MAQSLQRPPLHDRHVALGARMVPFAGWEMPVQYDGVIPEHLAVRSDCGVFDVSHMGEIEVEGPRARELLESLLSNDLDRIEPGKAQYTLLTNEQGGIVDDLIVYERDPERFLLIVNAANREADFSWLHDREIAGVSCTINRTGYTGEAGCELLVPAAEGGELWDRVLERGAVPCGLGARDTLRLEVCYPLHGNDIGPDTDAISAGLGWVCALDKESTGVEELRRIKEAGPARRLVAFVMEDPGIPRQGMAIAGGGEVTSGSHSPMLERGIGMGYVPSAHAQPDSELTIDVRGRPRRARVVKKPIYSREEQDGR